MEVRELTEDAERRRAVPLLRQLWTDADPEEVLDWTGADDYHLFGGFREDDLLAVAGVQLSNHLHHVRVAWLYDLVVDDPHRGEGHGGDLLSFVESWADERGCERVALASPLAKEGVHDFYERHGYDRWGYVIEREL